ncbi:glycosyltransferase family 2 protein [Desmospora profundinema]|uniref:Glucosyl-3-phosphoglycerate synthase n=1 Tax=Desmospora profundinema TaxID=1571184 RepID=A0ABU1IJB9_9BACL|nr:glycosyltransferase family 2 protein [Desmospora profundinema]MDR6224632.1 glycosyltransferase involved in cell wall biosynthesis [Desmospora profundinema]
MSKAIRVSAIIPARNEEARIEATLKALKRIPLIDEIIVIDDGSCDQTASLARPLAHRVESFSQNLGKGAALARGVKRARGEILLFVDADLEGHARLCGPLLTPVLDGKAHMTIARFPAPRKKGGFGFVKGLAKNGVRWLTGSTLDATLSGQRALKREVWERFTTVPPGFGIELGLTVHALRSGCRVEEIPLPMGHRETGRDWRGFVHRGKQFVAILRTLIHLWRQPA